MYVCVHTLGICTITTLDLLQSVENMDECIYLKIKKGKPDIFSIEITDKMHL